MEGGIAILLLVIIFVIAVPLALALSGTGSFLWWRKTDPSGDRAEPAVDDQGHPTHTTPTTPAQERTEFVDVRDAEGRR